MSDFLGAQDPLYQAHQETLKRIKLEDPSDTCLVKEEVLPMLAQADLKMEDEYSDGLFGLRTDSTAQEDNEQD